MKHRLFTIISLIGSISVGSVSRPVLVRASPDCPAVVEGTNNAVDASTFCPTISGGQNNTASGDATTVGGGYTNDASANSATVSGGVNNTASFYSSTVSGGSHNHARADIATVGGGANNIADGSYATVSGGLANSANGVVATIGGGVSNTATGLRATVGGGSTNRVTDDYATVGGGGNNQAGNNAGTTADHPYATVAGGQGNLASGTHTVVGGGYSNRATGYMGVVPGGFTNTAAGAYSLAAGTRAKANHQGAFVWSDSKGFDFASTAVNQFNVRATGGVRFVSGINASTGAPLAGVQLAAGGGAWSTLSDKGSKANFVAVDGTAMLEKLAAIPVEVWNYKAQDASIKHIGPMAQDFAAAFGVGEDDTHISTVDADGVALAAIQGLYKENQALRHELATLKVDVAHLQGSNTPATTAITTIPSGLTLSWSIIAVVGILLIVSLIVSSVSLKLLFLRRRTTPM